VTAPGYVIDDGPAGCWIWIGPRSPNGYGRIWRKDSTETYAHRYVFELFRGPIPRALELDHRCHQIETCTGGPTCPHRPCVNPWHLTPVTRAENLAPDRAQPGARGASWAAGTCKRGHDVTDPAAVYVRPDGTRECRACKYAREPVIWGYATGTCRRGHDVTAPDALYLAPSGKRECRACRRSRTDPA
jgi:hypothetical protein